MFFLVHIMQRHTSDTNVAAGSSVVEKGGNTATSAVANVLPQTGDHTGDAGIAVTLGTVAAVSTLVVDKRDKKDQNIINAAVSSTDWCGW